jgi:glycosyltransferase involved in cell wall biosynthesis
MIYLAMPVGSMHGWGICGKYFARELSAWDQVRLLTQGLSPQAVPDEFELRSLVALLPPQNDPTQQNRPLRVEAPVLMGIPGENLLPCRPGLRGNITVGYTFFETHLPPESLANANANYDLVAAGCTWCEQRLRDAGLTHTTTILQGVDPRYFFPSATPRQHLQDQFVIFSGGKFELRKGQDLVIRAVKILQDKYKDVFLVNAWFNPWPASFLTMRASPLIRCAPASGEYQNIINQILADNGIDPRRTLTLGPRDNATMRFVYENTDLGLFPNRCEGGTNLVLMEYMACGKPVVAAYNTGHCDVLNEHNSIRIMDHKPLPVSDGTRQVATWCDPSLDETIARLEWAYLNREKLQSIGDQAGQDMALRTWQQSARQFYELLKSDPSPQ